MHYKKLENIESRIDLPLNGPSNYRVNDNIIYTRAIEINAVRQCNLSCRSCSHSSPIALCQEYNPTVIEKDLSTLSHFLHCEFIRLLGGEPMLHSNLLKVLIAIKQSKIADKICLVTNGLLLDRLSEKMLDFIDKIEISIYPLSKNVLQAIQNNAINLSKKGVKVRLLEYSDFRESIVQQGTNNEKLIQLVYDTCQIAHTLRCITIDNNRIYRCPQSMINSENNNEFSDSISIDKLSSVDELLMFLENNNYLRSCSSCLGSVGKKISHEQVCREQWTELLPITIEEGIDKEYAGSLVKKLEYKNDCMKRYHLN